MATTTTTYLGELCVRGEHGELQVRRTHQFDAPTLEWAQRQANDWALTAGGSLEQITALRIRDGDKIVWVRQLDEAPDA